MDDLKLKAAKKALIRGDFNYFERSATSGREDDFNSAITVIRRYNNDSGHEFLGHNYLCLVLKKMNAAIDRKRKEEKRKP